MVKITVGEIEIIPKILNSYFICICKNFSGFSRTFSFCFSFIENFSRPEIHFFIFKVIQVFQGAWSSVVSRSVCQSLPRYFVI